MTKPKPKGGAKGSVGSVSNEHQPPRTATLKPRNPENLTKAEELYVKDSLKDLKAGRFEVSDSKESSEELLQKLKKEPESLSFPISDWKGRKARVSLEKRKR